MKKLSPEEVKKRRAEYFKEYYEKKKKDISEKRKKLYKENPEYQKRVAVINTRSYAKRVHGKPKETQRKTFDELGNQLFHIAEVAHAIGKAVYTLRKYHETGVLPETKRDPSRLWRLYTQDQLAWLKRIFNECKDDSLTGHTDLNCVALRIRQVWDVPFDPEKYF